MSNLVKIPLLPSIKAQGCDEVLDDTPSGSPAPIPHVISLPIKVPNLSICNMRSLAPKIDELDAVVSINHADIICITETWLSSAIFDNVIALPNFNLFRNDRLSSIGGGVCAYINSNIYCRHLTEFESPTIESLWLLVRRTQEVTPHSLGYFAGCCISLYSIAPI